MSGRGRPLRFLVAVVGGWTLLRVVTLMPDVPGAPEAAAEPRAGFAALETLPPRPIADGVSRRTAMPPTLPARAAPRRAAVRMQAAPSADRVRLAPLVRMSFGEPRRPSRPVVVSPLLAPPRPETGSVPPARPRLNGSAWAAIRGRGPDSLGPGGQLGGSQAGVRLRYELGQARRFAMSARVSSPLQGRGAEAGVGVEWRPGGAPVAILAEQRIGIDGTPGGPSLMAIGGIAPMPVGGGFTLEGYGQAGAVLRSGRGEPFADGALRLARPVARVGGGEVTLGGGVWGGAQRDAARLDIGPSIAVALPVAKRGVRLSLDWRERVAGGARPGSGLALTLGSDF